MILFSAILIGGHLVTVATAQVPELNFAPICQDQAGEDPGLQDPTGICMRVETTARAELAEKWSEFDPADRTSCVRLATENHTASYVEVLTCLEMDRDARKLQKTADLRTGTPEPREPRPERDRAAAQIHGQVARHSAPVPLTPPEPQSGILKVFCVPGLKDILPACQSYR